MSRLTKKFAGKVVLPSIPMEIKTKEDLDKYHEIRRECETMAIKLAEYEDREEKEIKKLRIFHIDDGEQHNIVAYTKDDAVKLFIGELNFEDRKESDIEITELDRNTDENVNLSGDDDLLLAMINRYRNQKERIETVNIFDLLEYCKLERKLKGNELEVPFIISSSTF